ncbi:MAG: hypothetical protein KatS3mg053_0849 [Candidatus Roseilinea sp.]|nr:MAG: hypothetical protein KatS3mg053_0849 [Candidatus Roseilinea sp.]
MAGDAFLGRWLVSEYVFDDSGAFVGVNRQQRILERLDNGRIRVTQRCRPDASLSHHAMAAFAGEWVFELAVEGRTRRYLGPDVLGSAMGWGEGATTGRGVWPRFGHNFVSWSVMAAPQRQLTGGRFFDAGACVAHIIGVGQTVAPEDNAELYPSLDLAARPETLAREWRGVRARFDAAGECLGEEPMARSHHPSGWREGEWPLTWAAQGARLSVVSAGLSAVGRRVGPALEIEGALADGAHISMLEVLDAATRTLVGIHRVFEAERLQRVAVIRLGAVLKKE